MKLSYVSALFSWAVNNYDDDYTVKIASIASLSPCATGTRLNNECSYRNINNQYFSSQAPSAYNSNLSPYSEMTSPLQENTS